MIKRKLSTCIKMFIVLSLAACSGSEPECLPKPDITLTAKHMKEESGQSTIEGSVFNSSLTNDYKDPKLRIDFYDATGKNISAQEFTIEKKIGKGQAEEFSFDFMAPVGADSASWSIACAKDL
jgi:hypothetical protein